MLGNRNVIIRYVTEFAKDAADGVRVLSENVVLALTRESRNIAALRSHVSALAGPETADAVQSLVGRSGAVSLVAWHAARLAVVCDDRDVRRSLAEQLCLSSARAAEMIQTPYGAFPALLKNLAVENIPPE